MADSQWFSRSRPSGTPKQRLFCLPHAGGGTAIYHRWKAHLPESIDLVAVNLPGREKRLREPPLEDLRELACQIVAEGSLFDDLPFAIFGHSMGAVVGYRVAVRLAEQQRRQPTTLFASACLSPDTRTVASPLHTRNDDEMLEGLLARYSNSYETDPSASGELEMMRFMANTIRADLKAMETYQHDDPSPLDCEIVAMGGTDDPQVKLGQLQRWQHLTTGKFTTRIFPGHHFYLRKQESAVVKTVVGRLQSAV